MRGSSVDSAIAEKCRKSPSEVGLLYIGETERIPLAPAAAASRAQKTALAVWLPPAPAKMDTRPPAALTTAAVTALRSEPERVADSPVVPQGTRKSIPCSICQSTSLSRAPKSIRPFSSKGVIRAVPHPLHSTRALVAAAVFTGPPSGVLQTH